MTNDTTADNTTEKLINRVRAAMAHGLSGADIAEHFAGDATPEEVWLAFIAARILDRDEEAARLEEEHFGRLAALDCSYRF